MAAIATLAPGLKAQSQPALENNPKALVDEAWQLVYREYVDRTFNQQDWLQVRQEYLKPSYSSPEQAYQAIREMLNRLNDPYTSFMTQREVQSLVNDVSGDFVGIGLTVGVHERTQEWIVVRPIAGSPAATAGILPRDVVLKINGQPTAKIDPNRASKYLIGPVGSQVLLTIRRGTQELNFRLLREKIDLNPPIYRVYRTPAGPIGYLYIPVFTSKAPQVLREAIQTLEQQQVKGYVLDLRSNPGGILDASLDIARMFMGQGTVVSVVNYRGQKESFTAKRQPLTNKPLQVLVDGQSASASEILAGALQDNRRATLVGTRTFGKGLVQTLEQLEDGSGLRITVARYFTPKGRDINKVGIEPDIVVPLTEQERRQLVQNRAIATEADPQFSRAIRNLLNEFGG